MTTRPICDVQAVVTIHVSPVTDAAQVCSCRRPRTSRGPDRRPRRPQGILDMSVTPLVSHAPMSSLLDAAALAKPQNKSHVRHPPSLTRRNVADGCFVASEIATPKVVSVITVLRLNAARRLHWVSSNAS